MSARLGDEQLVTPVSGSVTVVRSSGSALSAGPETDTEKTQPIRPMTSWTLLWHALRFRLITWRRPRAGRTTTAAAVPVVLVAALLLEHDTDARDAAQAVPVGEPQTTATGTPAPPLPVPGNRRAPVTAQEDPGAVAPRVPSEQELAALPKAVIGAAVNTAPTDPAPSAAPGTTMLHPTKDVAVYAEPGGCAIAVLPARQLLTSTWVPVVERRPGWALVLLPTRPHPAGVAAAGWIHLQPTVELADGDRRVEVDTATGRVSVLAVLGGVTTSSALGTPRPAGTVSQAAPSPGTRSFVAVGGQVAEVSWLLRMLWPFAIDTSRVCTGAFTTVSVPGLPSSSPLGSLDANGCVAAPPALSSALTQVPAGTPVLLR
ncbi:hypothetical protein [Lentzea jiangxiensis]|uniref:Uncharacterized protein n=1 Tax=Lentzea jiangxiensis TaxID=641025 RepID=A0A1H0X4L0_9PSEU|nr:hypothetical protein [Lentzea jiangxiensis]SDP97873.1 hypothetical protein SAMN05421507_13429 [Lentzea jiangxiensis]